MRKSPWVQAGGTFRERKRTTDSSTTKYDKLVHDRVSRGVIDAIDDFEAHVGLVTAKKAEKIKAKKAADKAKRELAAKSKSGKEEGDDEDVYVDDKKFVNLPLPQCGMYDFGNAGIKPLSVKAFDPGIRENVLKCLHGNKKTFHTAPFGGNGMSFQDHCMCRPRIEPVIPQGVVCEVPPLGRSLSLQQHIDKGGHEREKLHPQVKINRTHELRQRLMYRYQAQRNVGFSFDEHYGYECKKGFSWKFQPWKYHEYLNSVEDSYEAPWWEKEPEDFTEDETMAYKILSSMEEFLHERLIRARELFQQFDTDNSGEIDPQEFQIGLKHFKFADVNMEDSLKIMKLIDIEFDGVLSLKEMDRTILAIGMFKIKHGERQRYTFDKHWKSELADNVIANLALDGQQDLPSEHQLATALPDGSKHYEIKSAGEQVQESMAKAAGPQRRQSFVDPDGMGEITQTTVVSPVAGPATTSAQRKASAEKSKVELRVPKAVPTTTAGQAGRRGSITAVALD